MGQAPDRRPQVVGEGGDLRLGDHRLVGSVRPFESARVELVREALKLLPALAFEPVAGTGAAVKVRIVDGCAHCPGRVDDRRRLEVVTRYALTLHAENRLGDFAEAVPIELAGDVEPADALRQDAISRSDVRRAVPVRQVAAVEPVRGRLDLLVRDRWEAEGREDSLDRARSALAHVYDLLFSQRLDSPIRSEEHT